MSKLETHSTHMSICPPQSKSRLGYLQLSGQDLVQSFLFLTWFFIPSKTLNTFFSASLKYLSTNTSQLTCVTIFFPDVYTVHTGQVLCHFYWRSFINYKRTLCAYQRTVRRTYLLPQVNAFFFSV